MTMFLRKRVALGINHFSNEIAAKKLINFWHQLCTIREIISKREKTFETMKNFCSDNRLQYCFDFIIWQIIHSV